MTNTERRRMHRRYKQTRFKIIVCALIIIFGVLILKGIDDIKIAVYDVLNNQNEQRLEMDQKNAVSEDLTPSTYILEPQERELIERVVMSESSIEGLTAQMAVAQTIYDRMNDWGDPLQVAIETYSTKDNGAPTDSVKLAVSSVFDNGERVYEGGTYQFHDNTVSPYWTSNKIKRGSIGRLTFYGGAV